MQQRQQSRQTVPNAAARQPAVSLPQQVARAPPPPDSPTKNQLQEPTKAGTRSSVAAPVSVATQPQSSGNAASVPSSSGTLAASTTPSEPETMQVESANTGSNKDLNPPPQETPMEEAVRVTRGRLRKRAAATGGT